MSEAFWVDCHRGPRHAFGADDLGLRTSDQRDRLIATAQGCDDEAQRWLGWRPDHLPDGELREEMLALPPGGIPNRDERWVRHYVVEVDDAVVGEVQLRHAWKSQWELGISLAPERRGQGVGRRALALTARMAHEHLGIEHLAAGTHPDNVACVRALLAAGFGPTTGEPEVTLPNGSRHPAAWFLHSAPGARSACRRWFL